MLDKTKTIETLKSTRQYFDEHYGVRSMRSVHWQGMNSMRAATLTSALKCPQTFSAKRE